MSKQTLDPRFAAEFLARAVESAGTVSDDVLWARADLDTPPMPPGCDATSPQTVVITLRENLNGPGVVRTFRVLVSDFRLLGAP